MIFDVLKVSGNLHLDLFVVSDFGPRSLNPKNYRYLCLTAGQLQSSRFHQFLT